EEGGSGPPSMNYYYFQAARGYLKSFDPHADVLDEKVWDKIRKESEDATFEGIGAILRGGDDDDVIVETPFPGSPALKSGLKAGDIIRKVDGKSITNLSLREVVSRIRGPRGTVVSLEIDRPTDLTTRKINIERDVIERKAVDSTYLKEDNVGIIHIRSFLFHETPITEMVREAYEDIRKQAGGDPAGLVIDLRNNPGGDLGEAVRVTGLFMEQEKVVTSLKSNSGVRDLESEGYPIVPDSVPLMVMVDAGSASASEIMASALQDHDRALVVGDRTFGKATVQQIQKLTTGAGAYLIKLTIARYYAPMGYTVQVHGVQPDIRLSDQKDGEFPLRFREEDMWHHLPELADKEPNPRRDKWIQSLKDKVNPANAEKYLKDHENDAVRPDYMLQRSLPYLRAMMKEKN
ncbi:MAG: PDZ domain-containing protein, partial [Leptospiraceae bacterium]|nr:PDZ domain-containing protein [Leptospiraceae bacterium]